MTRPLRICVDARLDSGLVGGVEQFLVGLAHGIALVDPPHQVDFITFAGRSDWLEPHLGRGMGLLFDESPRAPGRVRAALRNRPSARFVWDSVLPRLPGGLRVPARPGALDESRYDVVHLALQTRAFATRLPTVYNPHDLQHAHFPEFFSVRERLERDQVFRASCTAARVVVASSNWIRRDLISKYQLGPDKVEVIELGSPMDAEPTGVEDQGAGDVRTRLSLPQTYALYPAQTWPHKNHIALLDAIARLRKRGTIVPLVCVGAKNQHYAMIERHVRALGLTDDVRFPGFVSARDLRAIYAGARCVVIPTRFEAGSFPLNEAFSLGIAAAVSNVTSLPEQAGDAALIFDPQDVDAMATAVARLWTEPTLRAELIDRGRARIATKTWERAAAQYLASYERAWRTHTADARR